MSLMALEASVATGDSRDIILWIIIAAVALVLIVLSVAMSAMQKQKEKQKKQSGKKRSDE